MTWPGGKRGLGRGSAADFLFYKSQVIEAFFEDKSRTIVERFFFLRSSRRIVSFATLTRDIRQFNCDLN